MNTSKRKKLEAQLAALEIRITQGEAALAEAATGVSSFELDTGEADQTIRFSNVKTLQKYVDVMYAQCEHLERRLRGGTFTSIKTRRK